MVAFPGLPAKLDTTIASRQPGLEQTEPGERPAARGHGGRPSRVQSAQLSDRILDVATALFLGHGFGATSIEAVARRAGISKRTFYHRFRSKEALFEAVVRRMVERWTPSFDGALLDDVHLPEALRRIGSYMLEVALTPQALALYRIMIAEGERFPALARILHELGQAAGVARIAHDLKQRVDAGEIGAIDPHFAAEQFITMTVTGPRRRAMGLGDPLGPAERRRWIEATVQLFLDGCR
jgi:TetR/AcrR family transcriptional regulator, mexJK operon transcriptional repressor